MSYSYPSYVQLQLPSQQCAGSRARPSSPPWLTPPPAPIAPSSTGRRTDLARFPGLAALRVACEAETALQALARHPPSRASPSSSCPAVAAAIRRREHEPYETHRWLLRSRARPARSPPPPQRLLGQAPCWTGSLSTSTRSCPPLTARCWTGSAASWSPCWRRWSGSTLAAPRNLPRSFSSATPWAASSLARRQTTRGCPEARARAPLRIALAEAASARRSCRRGSLARCSALLPLVWPGARCTRWLSLLLV